MDHEDEQYRHSVRSEHCRKLAHKQRQVWELKHLGGHVTHHCGAERAMTEGMVFRRSGRGWTKCKWT